MSNKIWRPLEADFIPYQTWVFWTLPSRCLKINHTTSIIHSKYTKNVCNPNYINTNQYLFLKFFFIHLINLGSKSFPFFKYNIK